MSILLDDVYDRNSRAYNEGYDEFDDNLGGYYEGSIDEELANVDALDEMTDPISFMTEMICECDITMRSMEFNILGEEYMGLRESGYEVPISEASVAGFLNKAQDMLNTAWDNIQKFFKTVLNKIKSALKLDQRFLKAYESKAQGKKTMYKLPSSMAKMQTGHMKAIGKTAEEYFSIVEKLSEELGAAAESGNHSEKDALNVDYIKERLKSVSGKNGIPAFDDISKMKSDTSKEISDSKRDRKEMEVKGGWAVLEFKNGGEARDVIQKAYDKSKSVVTKQMRALKQLERVQRKGGVIGTDASKVVHGAVKSQRFLLKVLNAINKTTVKEVNFYRKELKNIIKKCAGGTMKDSGNFGKAPGDYEPSSMIDRAKEPKESKKKPAKKESGPDYASNYKNAKKNDPNVDYGNFGGERTQTRIGGRAGETAGNVTVANHDISTKKVWPRIDVSSIENVGATVDGGKTYRVKFKDHNGKTRYGTIATADIEKMGTYGWDNRKDFKEAVMMFEANILWDLFDDSVLF